ncbi:MAG: hypothetical protein NT027_02900 [Proteobacteria bacterium]|nr:hypothetical protein [Pseudomonadota bacterium]
MTAHLPLEIFVKTSDIWQRDKFNDPNAFSYLGKSLGSLLEGILDEIGVKDVPLIDGSVHSGAYITGRVYIAKGAIVEPTAMIQGPCIIGPGAEVRHGAYIRGCVFAGAGAVIGHSTEVKGSVFFDGAKAGHLSYVGDSILGSGVNLGAGTKLANLKLKGDEIRFKHPETQLPTPSGFRKFGSILGDYAQTGCNAVLSPGSLLLPETAVMSCVHFRGTLLKGYALK